MSAIKVGDPIRKIRSVQARSNWEIEATWDDDGEASAFVVDLEPTIFAYKFYRPLRNNRQLFETVHVDEYGTAIAWGDDEVDMSSTTIERLARETMRPHDFNAFLKRHGFRLEEAAAQLGISRRQVAYFASHKLVPRSIALACAYLDDKLSEKDRVNEEREISHALKSSMITTWDAKLYEYEGTSPYQQSNLMLVEPKPASRGSLVEASVIRVSHYQAARR